MLKLPNDNDSAVDDEDDGVDDDNFMTMTIFSMMIIN